MLFLSLDVFSGEKEGRMRYLFALQGKKFSQVQPAEFIAQLWFSLFHRYTGGSCPRDPSGHGGWSGSGRAIIIFPFSLFFSITF